MRVRSLNRQAARAAAFAAALAGLCLVARAGESVRVVSLTQVGPAASDRSNVADPRAFGGEPPAVKVGEKGELTVMVDRAKVIRLPERTQMVVIGNPAVADIAVQKNGIVVLTGKSFGTTNFLALDAAGNMLAEANVSVKAPSDSTVVVQRGLDRYTYSCTPACQPSVALGDATSYFSDVKGQADQHSAFAAQK